MTRPRPIKVLCAAVGGLLFSVWVATDPLTGTRTAQAGITPTSTYSTPIALTSDDRQVWVVNPENDSVTILNVRNDRNRVLATIQNVGDEPQSIALKPDKTKAYVANALSGDVAVIDMARRRVIKRIPVGTEPFGIALTPNGKKAFVANMGSDTISVINTRRDRVIATIPVEPKPRALAIGGGTGPDLKVFVVHLLARLRNNGRPVDQNEGADDGKEGRLTVIAVAGNSVLGVRSLNPIADTGFLSDGTTLGRQAQDGIFDHVTGAFPNLLEGIAIKGSKAYLPNTGSSPDGPVRFNVNVQSLITVYDINLGADANQTLNANKGVQFEPPGQRLFPTNPTAIAFKNNANEGFFTSAATNRIVRVVLDGAGAPSINAPTGPGQPSGIVRVEVGKNPKGIVINSNDTRAYVFNFISRSVSVVDIATGSATVNTEIAEIPTAPQPPAGTLAAKAHLGHELFVTSIGPPGTQENALPPAGRMSDFGWGDCYSCHPDGLTDGVVWMFGDGPRNTISMESTFAHPQPAGVQLTAGGAPIAPSSDQHVLNWSAVRDEVQDFELNTRGVSGGQGLIRLGDGSQDPCVFNLVIPPGNPCPANTAINTGRALEQDAIAAYHAFGIRAPVAPLRGQNVTAGRTLFANANCQSCHGGPKWSRSRVDFAPPPTGETITAGQLVRFLNPVGTFDATDFNEIRPNLAVANGALGFNIPSLLTVAAGAPYFHNGSAQTLEQVLDNVTHRSAGTSGVDTLANPNDRAALILFLKSIDATTPIFP